MEEISCEILRFSQNSNIEKPNFREISMFIKGNLANYVTANSIKNSFSLGSEHTAKNYIYYLENSYLIFMIKKFSTKIKEIQRFKR